MTQRLGLSLIGFLWLALCLAPGVHAQDYLYSIADQTLEYNPDTGEGSFEINISIIEDPESVDFPNPTEAFSMGVESDPDYVVPCDYAFAGRLEDINGGDGPELLIFTVAEDDMGFIAACIYSIISTVEIETDGDMLTITYELNDETLVGEREDIDTDLTFVDTLNAPPTLINPNPPDVVNEVLIDGDSFGPEFDDAVITLSPSAGSLFIRGDVDSNGTTFPLVDGLYLLDWVFAGGDTPLCLDAADIDGNGTVFALIDALYVLNYAFADGPEPPDPGPDDCGVDPNVDTVGCEEPPDACL